MMVVGSQYRRHVKRTCIDRDLLLMLDIAVSLSHDLRLYALTVVIIEYELSSTRCE